MKSTWYRLSRLFLLALVCLGLLLILAQEWPDQTTEDYQYGSIIHNRRFDFIRWELSALGGKMLYSLAPAHSFMEPDTQKKVVQSYFDQLREAQSLEWQIATIYTDPTVTDPETATADLDQELEQVRKELENLQALAEAILEEQTATILAEQGIATAGRAFPPVKLRFTPLPAMLIISPRDHIDATHFFSLEHGIETAVRVELERAIDEKLDVSSLVSNIGGLAAYPAMMLESSATNWVIETGAHEWTHHYLTLRPLGILYDTNPQLRTMNETSASIVGTEIGGQVIQRYYPEWAPPPPVPPSAEPDPTPTPPTFEFRVEMRVTRLHVDELLAQGQIEEAETYMEARRQIFWENGYQIRKINQAYFAFHGAYADEPGAPGADPVGPAVLALRARSSSLKEFLDAMSPLTSFAELEELLNE